MRLLELQTEADSRQACAAAGREVPDTNLRGWGVRVSPKIRLQGDWLERAGFAPGSRVLITETAPGRLLIEARVFGSEVAQ